MMAKRSRKLSTRREKDRGGCMWSLVSKLHSRSSGSTRKLLFDQKCRTEAAAGNDLSFCRSSWRRSQSDYSRGKRTLLYLRSELCLDACLNCDFLSTGYGILRTSSNLMVGHDANVQDGERTEFMAMGGKPSVKTLMEEEIEADAEWVNCLKLGKQSCDRVMDDDIQSSCNRSDEQGSSDDLRDIMEYLGSLFQQRSGIRGELNERSDEEKFSRAFTKALSRQLVNGRQLSEEEMIHCSKVFVSMLRILNSADFSLLELVRDPETFLRKCMEILQEHQLGRSSPKRLLVKSMSSEEGGECFQTNVSSPLVPSRIVILKPWMTELPKPAKSPNPGISRGIDSIDMKTQKKKSGVPGFLSDIKRKLKTMVAKESADKSADSTGEKSRKGRGRRDFKREPAGVSFRNNKYLFEEIIDDNYDGSSSNRDPETMGKILLHPELNCSLRTSPGRRWEDGAVNGSSSQIVRDKRRKPEFTGVAETDMYAFKFLDGASTKVVSDSTEQSSRGVESLDGLLIIEKGDSLDIVVDLPERPSPVSILEPHFSDDDISPAMSEGDTPARNFPRQHLEIELEEDDDVYFDEADAHERTFEEDTGLVLDRVAALLRTTDLTWEELYLKSQSSDQLLEPSLLRNQHLFKDDTKLLVDCINEVLSEACGQFIGRSCTSLARRRIKPVPSMDFTIREVCRGVKWHLDPIPQPRSLEQMVGRDMSRTGSWPELTREGESIGFELCDAIFAELVEEVGSS